MKKMAFTVLFVAAAACSPPPEEYTPAPEIAPSEGSWAMFRADAQRTGLSTSSAIPEEVSEAWRVANINTTDYGAAKASPSVADGVLYVGSDDARFGAYDVETGDLLWEVEVPETTQGFHGTPSIGAEMVMIGAYNGTLYAFDRETGETKWEYTNGFQIGASPALVPEHGRVYNTHERSNKGGGQIVAVDALTGEEVWDVAIRAHPHSSVAVSVEQNRLFVGDNLAILHAVDTETGEVAWTYQLPQPGDSQSDIKTTPTVIEEHGLVVVGAWSKKIHAFDMESGELVWETEVGASVMGSTAYSPKHGLVYLPTLSPTRGLHAFDVETGEEKWKYESESGVMSSPAIDMDEKYVVVGSGPHMFAVDAETGEELWKVEVGGNVTASPALWGDRIFITAKLGDLVAYE